MNDNAPILPPGRVLQPSPVHVLGSAPAPSIANEELVVRAVDDLRDPPGIVALIGLCFSDYPDCFLDVDREERGLLAPSRSYDRFWVVTWQDRVLGTIALGEHEVDGEPGVELKKLYVHPWLRGRGMGRRLCLLVEDHARSTRRGLIELWTDTRFETAHAMYAHLGYRRTGEIRPLHDLSRTEEYRFLKRL